MNATERRDAYRAFLKRAANAQDARAPLKALVQTDAREDIFNLCVFGMIRVDDLSDGILVTIDGRLFAGLLTGDTHDFGPGKLAEIRGSVTESELAARYLDGKVAGVEKVMKDNPHERDQLQWLGLILKNAANEMRQQMHIPAIVLEGRVIPYNETNETGIKHAANLHLFFNDVHERNVRAGWWSDLETGEPKRRNPGELMMLMVTEMAEAYDSWRTGEPDDKLTHLPGFPVEMADIGIRWADFCGALMAGRIIQPMGAANPGDQMFQEVCAIARHYESIRKTPAAVGEPETADFLLPMDVAAMTDQKLTFNATRADHQVENRLKEDGKRT